MDAYLASPDTCKVLYLRKAVGPRPNRFRKGRTVQYYHADPKGGPLNHEQELMNKAVWEFLAEHAGKEIKIALGELELYEIVGDNEDSIWQESYTRDWPPRGSN